MWEAQDIGLATGILGSIRGLGGAVATALYSSVLTNELNKNLPKYVVPAATGAGLSATSLEPLFTAIAAGNFSTVPGINQDIVAAVMGAVKTAYTSSFQVVFYTTIPFSAVLLLSSFLVPNMEKFLSHDVAKRLQDMPSSGDLENTDSERRVQSVGS